MSDINISVDGGTSKRLLTAGKYCESDILVTASGGGDDGSFKSVLEGTAVKPTLPSDLTKIRQYGFYPCYQLALTSLPDGVTEIGREAFYSCSHLALASLPSSLESIGSYAFYACTSLALTSIPASVKTIGSSAFSACNKLRSITFEGTPTNIASSAFSYCGYLVTLNVPWAEGAVANAPWGATNATINYNYTGA